MQPTETPRVWGQILSFDISRVVSRQSILAPLSNSTANRPETRTARAAGLFSMDYVDEL